MSSRVRRQATSIVSPDQRAAAAGVDQPAFRVLAETTPAAIFPQRAPFGLAEGAPANFIALERNPLEDLEAISWVSLRVKGGRELLLSR